MITNYFKKIQRLLNQNNHIIENQSIKTKTYTDSMGFITGELHFVDESELDFVEVVNTNKSCKDKYKYHYMDKDITPPASTPYYQSTESLRQKRPCKRQ